MMYRCHAPMSEVYVCMHVYNNRKSLVYAVGQICAGNSTPFQVIFKIDVW